MVNTIARGCEGKKEDGKQVRSDKKPQHCSSKYQKSMGKM